MSTAHAKTPSPSRRGSKAPKLYIPPGVSIYQNDCMSRPEQFDTLGVQPVRFTPFQISLIDKTTTTSAPQAKAVEPTGRNVTESHHLVPGLIASNARWGERAVLVPNFRNPQQYKTYFDTPGPFKNDQKSKGQYVLHPKARIDNHPATNRWIADPNFENAKDDKAVAKVLETTMAAQLQLLQQYRHYQAIQDRTHTVKSPQGRLEPWHILLESVGACKTGGREMDLYFMKMKIEGHGIYRKQRDNFEAMKNRLLKMRGDTIAASLQREHGLKLDKSAYFTTASKHKFSLCPLPYGPRIDDKLRFVDHWLLWTEHDFYNPTEFAAEELQERIRWGMSGFTGFKETEYIEDANGKALIGHTDIQGSQQIRAAIEARFPPAQYRCAWFINARKAMTVPGLPHLHLWVVKTDDDNLIHGQARLGSTVQARQNHTLKGGNKKGGKKVFKH